MATPSDPVVNTPLVTGVVEGVDYQAKQKENAVHGKQTPVVFGTAKKIEKLPKSTSAVGKSSMLKVDSSAKAKAGTLNIIDGSKRRRIGKVTVVPKGYRFFRVLVNGFKQSCHAFVKEKCNLRQFRKAMFECQQDHPQAISEAAWSRAVILKSKPTTMKTNCCLTMDSVLQDDPETYISSMPTLDCVHIYMLCPGPPLPKEFPGPHMRLAKRDTRVCEAHGKQERRALRRTGGARASHANRRINAADVLDSNGGGDSKKHHTSSLSEASNEEASIGVVSYVRTPLFDLSSLDVGFVFYFFLNFTRQRSGKSDSLKQLYVLQVLAGPLVAAALASSDSDGHIVPSVVAPPTFPIQFNPNDPPVICSIQQTAFDGPHSPSDTNSDTSGDEKGIPKKRIISDSTQSSGAASPMTVEDGSPGNGSLLGAVLRGAAQSSKKRAAPSGVYDDSDTDSVSSGDDCGGRSPKYRRTAAAPATATSASTLASTTMAAARAYSGGGDVALRAQHVTPQDAGSKTPKATTSPRAKNTVSVTGLGTTPATFTTSRQSTTKPASEVSSGVLKSHGSDSRALCCVPGCGSVASLDVIGNTMVFPRHFDRRGEEFLFCCACVDKFNAITLSQLVMESMASCPHQHVHEQHLDFATTPKAGPLRYGRLAGWGVAPAAGPGATAPQRGTAGTSAVFFCSCIREACAAGTEADTHALHAFLAYLAMGLRPTWKPSGAPEVVCTGSTAVHIRFPRRAHRILLSVEVLAMDAADRCVRSNADNVFQYFGENFEDCIHVVPGFPVDKTDYMVEGLDAERRYAVRTVETIAGARGVALQLNMRRLCTVPSKHVVVQTSPDMPVQKPYISLQPCPNQPVQPSAAAPVVGSSSSSVAGGGAAEALATSRRIVSKDNSLGKSNAKSNGSTQAMDMLLHLAHVATSETDASAVMMFGNVGGRHSFAVPIRVDQESSQRTDPVVAQTHRRGDQFTVFPQVVGCLTVMGDKRTCVRACLCVRDALSCCGICAQRIYIFAPCVFLFCCGAQHIAIMIACETTCACFVCV